MLGHIRLPRSKIVRPPVVRIFIFYDSVLVVRAYATECGILIFPINSVDETIVRKTAVVGVVVLNGSSSLCHEFLHC